MPGGSRSSGFLAGYRGLTREACTLDMRQFTGWCRTRSLPLFSVRRADIETLAREPEARGRARATVARRLCTIAEFYRYAPGSGQMTRGSRLRACISASGAAVYPGGYTRWVAPPVPPPAAASPSSFSTRVPCPGARRARQSSGGGVTLDPVFGSEGIQR